MTRIAYLGPRGSFAEAALRTLVSGASDDLVPAVSVQAALDAVRSGAVDQALVPIENSVEGSVSITLDELAVGDRLVIVDEVAIPVRFDLMVRPGTTLTNVGRVATHPRSRHRSMPPWLNPSRQRSTDLKSSRPTFRTPKTRLPVSSWCSAPACTRSRPGPIRRP